MRRIMILMSLFLLAAGCGRSKSKEKEAAPTEAPAPTQVKEWPIPYMPKALDFSAFKYSNFGKAPIEKRCEALREFAQFYREKYLPNAEITRLSCRLNSYFTDAPVVDYSADVEVKTKDEKVTGFHVRFHVARTFTVKKTDLQLCETSSNCGVHTIPAVSNQQERETLADFIPTVESWLKIDSQSMLKDAPHDDLVRDTLKKYADFSTLVGKRRKGDIVFKLVPSAEASEGTVVFQAVDPVFFGLEFTDPQAKTYLGCPDLDCLNSSKVIYSISDGILGFIRTSRNSMWGDSWWLY